MRKPRLEDHVRTRFSAGWSLAESESEVSGMNEDGSVAGVFFGDASTSN